MSLSNNNPPFDTIFSLDDSNCSHASFDIPEAYDYQLDLIPSFIPDNNVNISEDNLERIYFLQRKNKRGRKGKNSGKIHGNDNFDNIERKTQVHFLTFLINFCNVALKMEKKNSKFTFKQINSKYKITVNHKYTSYLKQSSIKDILNMEISVKCKRYENDYNKKLYNKIVKTSEWLKNLFEMKYLKLFNYYFNEKKPLKKIVFENKEITLSSKTKSFYYLLEKNEDLRQNILEAVKNVYFDGYDSWNNIFRIKSISEHEEN